MIAKRRILLIHQNFPGQFKHLAPELARQGHEVVALGINAAQVEMPGVRYFQYRLPEPPRGAGPDFINELHTKVIRGQAAAAAMEQLKAAGFTPDVVFAHPGWGEAFFISDVFPAARLLVYAEYFYGSAGGDTGFDPEFWRNDLASGQRTRIKNTHLLHAMSVADAGLSPTVFQRDRHPPWFRDRITVIHEGIDTERFRPDSEASVHLRSAGLTMRPGDEVVTFVARELEPYRGYHIFMRALPKLMQLRPNARIVVVGGDDVSYGSAPPSGQTWKNIFLNEVASRLDMRRIHFVGKLPHTVLTQLMQVSAVHTYLTYPFVLSWSLMEAMSVGCLIVASRTAPVEEVIAHGHNGLLVDFFDHEALALSIADALERRQELRPLREAARATIVERYDLQRHCLPALARFVIE
jgi:glycosyltransferase involved in cell wall biosynthesis